MGTGIMNRWRGAVKAALLIVDHNVAAGRVLDSASGKSLRLSWTNAGAPTNGTSGTLAGFALPSDLMLDTTNKVLYQNTNTQASPTWTALTTATGAGTYTGTFDGVVGGTTPAAGSFTTLVATGLRTASVANALTAAGTNRATSLALTAEINRITTAAASTGVNLAALTAGQWQDVYNDGSNPVTVYAPGSITVDGVAGATGVPLTNAKRCRYSCVAANTVISAQLGAISA